MLQAYNGSHFTWSQSQGSDGLALLPEFPTIHRSVGEAAVSAGHRAWEPYMCSREAQTLPWGSKEPLKTGAVSFLLPLIFFEFFLPFMKWSLCPKDTRRMMGKGFEEGLLMLLIWPSHLLRWPNQMEKDRICVF